MGLKATLRRAVKAAFRAIGDINKEVSYKSVSGTLVRDLAAGTSSYPTTPYPLSLVVFTGFKEAEQDKNPALKTGMKMLFPTEDLPVAPKSADTVVDDAGTVWEVITRLSDPADVLTSLHVRTG